MLTESLNPTWSCRRKAINHSWLQNVFLESVCDTIERLRLTEPDWTSAMSAFHNRISEWTVQKDALEELVDSFEVEMSPVVLFKKPPLSYEQTHTKEWMMPLVHSLWKQRNGIRKKLQVVRESISRTDVICKRLEMECKSKQRDLGQIVDLLQELETACLALASSIHILPDGVLVT
jgi:hypothetical protein